MRLIIPGPVEEKLHAYVMSVNSEIAGMGKVRIEENGDIIVEEICIYEQEVTGGTADLSTTALAGFMMEKLTANESLAPWTLWWHSHDNMAAFFSGRDTATIDQSTDFNYLISLVVNKRRERECRIDTYRPFRLTQEDVSVVVPSSEYTVPDDIKEEVAAKVKTKVWPTYNGHTGSGAGFGRHDHEGPKKVGSLLSPYGNGHFLNESKKDFDDWNPNKGNATVVTDVEFDGPEDMDSAEIASIVAGIKNAMEALSYAGKDDTEEFTKMQRDLADWEYELAEKEREEYLDAYGTDNPKS